MVNKKAQNLSLTTIILIVLGIVLLVLLIWGFSTGWGNLWERINFWSGGSNVDTIKQACDLACSTGSEAKYCSEVKTLKLNEKTIKGSCKNFEDEEVGISCSKNLCNTANTYEQTCSDLGGEWKSDCGGKNTLGPGNKADIDAHPYDGCCEK
jgi:hypothetical protein